MRGSGRACILCAVWPHLGSPRSWVLCKLQENVQFRTTHTSFSAPHLEAVVLGVHVGAGILGGKGVQLRGRAQGRAN